MKAKFKKTVDSGDLEGTRISLANEMMLDPRGDSFIEMRNYAETYFPNLYDKHDGASFDKNQDNWDETLLFSTKNALDNNFSRERLEFYYNIAKVVLKEKADTLTSEKDKKISYPEQGCNNQTASEQGKKKGHLYLGLTIGGFIIGGTGLIMGKTIITTIGLAGAAVGSVLLCNDKRNKK